MIAASKDLRKIHWSSHAAAVWELRSYAIGITAGTGVCCK